MFRDNVSGEDQIKFNFKNIKIIILYITGFWLLLPSFLFSVGYNFDKLLPIDTVKIEAICNFGWVFFAIGLIITSGSIYNLMSLGKGYPISHLPPQKIVRRGFYKYTKHPIYIGYTFLYIGAALIIKSVWSAFVGAFILFPMWIIYAHYIEEPALVKRFGNEYIKYKSEVPLFSSAIFIKGLNKYFNKLIERFYPAINFLANKTILFRIGDSIFVTYGLFIAVGAFLFMCFSSILLFEIGLKSNDVLMLITFSSIGGLLFGRFFYWLGHAKELIKMPMFGLRKVGFVSYGDLTGILLPAIVFCYLKGINFFAVADAYTAGMFLAYSFGRIGCLTYGCCYGKKSGQTGVKYTNAHSKVLRENGAHICNRYPTQLYSSALGLLLFIVANLLLSANLPYGLTTVVVFLLYSLGRIVIEFYRDRKRYFNGTATLGTFGGLVIFFTGYFMLFFINKNNIAKGIEINSTALGNIFPLLPAFVLLSMLIFFVTGYHYKEIGNW